MYVLHCTCCKMTKKHFKSSSRQVLVVHNTTIFSKCPRSSYGWYFVSYVSVQTPEAIPAIVRKSHTWVLYIYRRSLFVFFVVQSGLNSFKLLWLHILIFHYFNISVVSWHLAPSWWNGFCLDVVNMIHTGWSTTRMST